MRGFVSFFGAVFSGLMAFAEPAPAPSRLVPYYDFNGTALEQKGAVDPITLTNGADRIGNASGEWYVVEGAVTTVNLRVEGTAHLILCDGAELTAGTDNSYGTAGIRVGPGASLFIYGQEGQTGLLTATAATEHGAGIGGNEGESCGTVTINGGVITARGGYTAAGIGGGSSQFVKTGVGGTVTINAGVVTATCSGYGGAGIGGGLYASAGTVTINGGVVTATGANWGGNVTSAGAGIGGGDASGLSSSGDSRVTVNGGTLRTTAGAACADDVGNGSGPVIQTTVTVTGGSVLRTYGTGSFKSADGRPLRCVTVDCGALGAGKLRVDGSDGYGSRDIFAIDGKVYLYLPDGTHVFSLSDGLKTSHYYAVLNGRDIAVEPFESSVGFFVNGVDVGEGQGTDWTYEDKILRFTADRTYVLSGQALNDEVQIDVEQTGVSLVLSNAVVFTKGRPALQVDYNSQWETPILMAGGTSCLSATNEAGGASVPAVTIGRHANVGLAPGGDRLESMIVVYNHGDSPAIAGTGEIAVNGGTFFVKGDVKGVETPARFTCGEDEVMKTGEAPGTMKFATTCDDKPCVLVGPGVTVTIADGIPHVGRFTVSNGVEQISGASATGGRAYRVMLNDDVFAAYEVEEGYVSRAANPLVYAAVKEDVTVGEDMAAFIRAKTGVTVNGTDVATGVGEGWEYHPKSEGGDGYVELLGAGSYVLSGTNTTGEVMFAADADMTLTLSNLCLGCVTAGECCLWATNDTVVTVRLAGTNTLDASSGGEGLCIENGCRLTVTAAPGFADTDAVLVAKGGSSCAAIATGRNNRQAGKSPYFEIAGGTVIATGGSNSAGIGGSNQTGKNSAAEMVISGGRVFATGARHAAGIGSSEKAYWGGPAITITGGYVEAQGGEGAAGIGGGFDSIIGTCVVRGGTVRASAGPDTLGDRPGRDDKAADMLAGHYRAWSDRFEISGGSVCLVHQKVRPQPVFIPSDGSSTQTVWCVTVEGLEGLVGLEGLEGYGLNDIFAIDGKVYLWLPDGSYEFKANGFTYVATVSGANTTATRKPVGVTVNGTDIAAGSGTGWTYDGTQWLRIADAGAYTLSGGATNDVCVDVCAGVTLTLDNLTLVRNAGGVVYGVLCFGQAGESTLLLAGTNRIEITNSNCCGAGIYVRTCKLTIDRAPDAEGSLCARAGRYGAGIGGYCCENGEIVIDGGDISAYGGYYSAGIGVGQYVSYHHRNKPITINGGHVLARGYTLSVPAIGGETASTSGETICITGGTVDAGDGWIGTTFGAGCETVFTGGSIYAGASSVNAAPSNGTARVYRVTVDGLEGLVRLEGLDGYGTDEIAAVGGKVYLWFPNGHYRFTANGETYVADVKDAPTTARRRTDLGVTVNGTDIEIGAGEGWTYADGVLTLSGAGPFLVSGTNTAGEVAIVQSAASTVTVSNLVLATADLAPYAVRASGSPRLLLAGANELSATAAAAVDVPDGIQLAIDCAEGCAGASLTAVGGTKAAAIGGGPQKPQGMINIYGGRIVATGGESAAAIGSGGYAYAATSVVGEVHVYGGYVTASAGSGAAALGGGYDSIFGDVVIHGGTVDAGGAEDRENDIGNGWHVGGRTVTICGGSVLARAAKINLPPTDGRHVAVWCVTVEGLEGLVGLEGLEGYGTDGIVAIDGKVYLYLPDGNYQFKANGVDYYATVDGAPTTAQRGFAPSGVTVNGTDLATGAGTGWTWNRGTDTLTCDAGDFVLSGTNAGLAVNASLADGATVVASNLVLAAFNGPLSVGGTTVDLGSLGGPLTVTGGSVRLGNDAVASNLTERVWCVTVEGLEGSVGLKGLDGYGTNDIVAIDGKVYLWLPNGIHAFEANGTRYYANVVDAATNAATFVGFTVNGEDIIAGRGTGWTVTDEGLVLDGSETNAFALAGEPPLTIFATNVFAVGQESVSVTVDGSVLGVADGATFTLARKTEKRTVDDYAFAVKADGSLALGKGLYYFNPEGRYDTEAFASTLVADETWAIIDRLADTGVTVNWKDIGCVEWTADGSACHFDTNSWTLSFNLGARFLLEGTNLTERPISLVLATNELSVVFTNLIITANAGTSFTIAEGCDPAYWGFFTNTANDAVLVGEGVYAFDPTGRTLDGLVVGQVGANRWRVAPTGAFKARATIGGTTYSCLTLNEALKIAGKGGTIELDADIVGEELAVPSGSSFALIGNGRVILPESAADSAALITVASNCAISVANVVFDGNGVVSNALAAVESFGSLALTDCTVRGFRVPEGTLIEVDSAKGSAAPAVALKGLTTADNAALGAVGSVVGTSILTTDALADVIVLAEGAEIAFTNAAPTAQLVLNPLDAASRVGETLVRAIAGGVALDPAKVRICAAGYMAVGDGQGGIVLESVVSRPFAVGAGDTYDAYATFDEAIAAADGGRVASVYYENAPAHEAFATNVSDITVGEGTNAVLSTAYRTTPDGTNTVWSSQTAKRSVLTGRILVKGSLTLENVEVAAPVVLDGGVLAVGAGYDVTNSAPVEVSFASMPAEGTLVVRSSAYSAADLQGAFNVRMSGYVLTAEEGGLAVRTVSNSYVAKIGSACFHGLAAAFEAAEDGDTVEAITLTNAAQRTIRDTVRAGGICTLASGRRVTLGSAVCEMDAFGRISALDVTNALTTVDWSGAKLVIEADAVLAVSNVVFAGTLDLAGAGLLDLKAYVGKITVNPQRTGRIAVNAAGKLSLADVARGELVFLANGDAIYRVGTFWAEFVETGNGVGYIAVNDHGVCSTNAYNEPVRSGSVSWCYDRQSETGEKRDLAFGVIYVDVANNIVTLPTVDCANADPCYLANDGKTLKPLKDYIPSDAQLEGDIGNQTVTLSNYGHRFKVGGFNFYVGEEQESVAAQQRSDATEEVRKKHKGDPVFERIFDLLGDMINDVVKIAVNAVIVAVDAAVGKVKMTIDKIIATIEGLVSLILRSSSDLYIGEGRDDDDYYEANAAKKAFDKVKNKDSAVHFMRDVRMSPYALDDSDRLSVDMAGSPRLDVSFVAVWVGWTIEDLDPVSQTLVNGIVSEIVKLGIKGLEELVYQASDGHFPHHTSAASSSSSGAWLTVTDGASIELKNFKENNWTLADPLAIVQDGGRLTVESSEITGFTTTDGNGVVRVYGTGHVTFSDSKVTGNRKSSGALANVYVNSSSNLSVQDDSCRVGISGRTENGEAFAQTGGKTRAWSSIYSNDAHPNDKRYEIVVNDKNELCWKLNAPEPLPPSFPEPGDEARTGGHALDIRMITKEVNGVVMSYARIWGAPTNGVEGAWYYLMETQNLKDGKFSYLPNFKWLASGNGAVTEMTKGPDGSCCDVPAPSSITNRFFRIGAQKNEPGAAH